MKTKHSFYTQAALEAKTIKEICEIYNRFAEELGVKTLKKFSTKGDALKRTMSVQEKFDNYVDTTVEEVTEEVTEEEIAAKKIVELINKPEKKPLLERCDDAIKALNKTKVQESNYAIGPKAPKNPDSAMGIIYGFVKNSLFPSGSEICDFFIEQYSAIYKGKHEVNLGFAKGYLRGAVRAGHIVIEE